MSNSFRGYRSISNLMSGVKDPVTSSKRVDNNTMEIHYANGNTAYRLHDTDVVTKLPNGDIVLNSGGWKTNTTKDRINTYANGIYISQVKGIWYVKGYQFKDGMVVHPDGSITGAAKPNDKKIDKAKRDIDKFVALITENNLPQPSSGDCWYCLMKTQDGENLGDAFDDNSHLQSHLKEKYLHGSLLVNAMKEAGYSDRQIGFHYAMKYADTFKKALRKYLRKRLIPDLAF